MCRVRCGDGCKEKPGLGSLIGPYGVLVDSKFLFLIPLYVYWRTQILKSCSLLGGSIVNVPFTQDMRSSIRSREHLYSR